MDDLQLANGERALAKFEMYPAAPAGHSITKDVVNDSTPNIRRPVLRPAKLAPTVIWLTSPEQRKIFHARSNYQCGSCVAAIVPWDER